MKVVLRCTVVVKVFRLRLTRTSKNGISWFSLNSIVKLIFGCLVLRYCRKLVATLSNNAKVSSTYEGCPIYLIRNGSSNRLRSVTNRDGSSFLCQFAIDFEIIHGLVMERAEDVGESSRSGRIVITRHTGDGW